VDLKNENLNVIVKVKAFINQLLREIFIYGTYILLDILSRFM